MHDLVIYRSGAAWVAHDDEGELLRCSSQADALREVAELMTWRMPAVIVLVNEDDGGWREEIVHAQTRH